MGIKKDKNCKDLTEEEWQEYTEELSKKKSSS